MNIIFGDAVKSVPENYTVLELDTIRVESTGQLLTAYCLVDAVPLAEFPRLEQNIQAHSELLNQYRLKNWEFCVNSIELLLGCWNGDLDEFYNSLLNMYDAIYF